MPSIVDSEKIDGGETTATATEADVAMTDAADTDAPTTTAPAGPVTAVATKDDNTTTEENPVPAAATSASASVSSPIPTAAVSSSSGVGGKSLVNNNKQGKKPSRTTSPVGGGDSAAMSASQAIAAANLAAAVQMAASLQLNGLLSLLTQSSTPGSASAADPTVLQTSVFVSSANDAAWQVPTPDLVRQAAFKAVQEAPPFVHLSKTDSAPQLKIADAERLTLKGGMRGYRMSRATHGVSQATTGKIEGNYYYFEVIVLEPPTIAEIVSALPPNARLGPSLQNQIQHALEYAKKHPTSTATSMTKDESNAAPNTSQQSSSLSAIATAAISTVPAADTKADEKGTEVATPTAPDDITNKPGRKRKADDDTNDGNKKAKSTLLSSGPPQVGGHLRIGWSMRTGDLQAPVGYDKWSYGLRSIGGSKSHQSRREDGWGGQAWGRPGDVMGCAITLMNSNANGSVSCNSGVTDTAAKGTSTTNEIRFFKNGLNMGDFVIAKGKREGGAAFEDIQPGTYYPAISSYLGGSVQVNFGPHFVHPPKTQLPHGLTTTMFQPMASLQPPPLSNEELLARLKKKNIFAKVHAKEKTDTPEMKMAAFKEAVLVEAEVLQDAHRVHKKKHLLFVLQARKVRNINSTDIQEELDALLALEDGGGAVDVGTSGNAATAEAMDVEEATVKSSTASEEEVVKST